MKNSNQQQIFLFHNPIFQPKKLNEFGFSIFQWYHKSVLVMNMSHTFVDGKCEQLSFPVRARKLHL